MMPPAPNMPALPGRPRAGALPCAFGRRRSMLVAVQAMKAPKKSAIQRLGMKRTTWAAASEPTTMPGARVFTMSQRTAPRR